ncbi:hypothetical protein EG68_08480 [Paragonimus skrjabini miyazakii]|uniref:X-box-binding protein 1 n=1 Tax=Paragonimus skrjabini miyazakii TaxID=59628 RepID=A0A8S9YLI4_9TREM|nr:hypothetical protein EG68_08480 [Paragonimus skrjabini miyazakii]
MSGVRLGTSFVLSASSQGVPAPKVLYPISRFALGRKVGLQRDESQKYVPRKRARLDYLTEEQKMVRRKILNREAAQKARDKKRGLMETMESELATLQAENQYLRASNRFMQKKFKEQEERFIVLQKKLQDILGTVNKDRNYRVEPSESAVLLSQRKRCSESIHPPESTPITYFEEGDSPALFDGEVVEVSTADVEHETEASTLPQPSSDVAPPSLYDQLLGCLQDEGFPPFPSLSPASDSSEDFDDLMEFLYHDGFSPVGWSPSTSG